MNTNTHSCVEETKEIDFELSE